MIKTMLIRGYICLSTIPLGKFHTLLSFSLEERDRSAASSIYLLLKQMLHTSKPAEESLGQGWQVFVTFSAINARNLSEKPEGLLRGRKDGV
jgi:hypothetical protein